MQVCPHLRWQWMFYSFGSLGFLWVFFWLYHYNEVRGPHEEEFIEPPKVNNLPMECESMIMKTNFYISYYCHFYVNQFQRWRPPLFSFAQTLYYSSIFISISGVKHNCAMDRIFMSLATVVNLYSPFLNELVYIYHNAVVADLHGA